MQQHQNLDEFNQNLRALDAACDSSGASHLILQLVLSVLGVRLEYIEASFSLQVCRVQLDLVRQLILCGHLHASASGWVGQLQVAQCKHEWLDVTRRMEF